MITLLVAPGSLAPDAELGLDEAEGHHLRVRRGAVGERVRLLDGAGGSAEAVVVARGPALGVRCGAVASEPAPPPLVLGVGVGDRERWTWLAEKAAEVGVTRLVPLDVERSRSVAGRLRGEHVEKLRRRAREACKQSGAAWAPTVAEPVAFAAWLEQLEADGADRWLADGRGGPPRPVRGGAGLTVAVGPEGGFAEAERAALAAAGFAPVRLGAAVLRFETAAIAAAILRGAA